MERVCPDRMCALLHQCPVYCWVVAARARSPLREPGRKRRSKHFNRLLTILGHSKGDVKAEAKKGQVFFMFNDDVQATTGTEWSTYMALKNIGSDQAA
jgi:hypothetical protein